MFIPCLKFLRPGTSRAIGRSESDIVAAKPNVPLPRVITFTYFCVQIIPFGGGGAAGYLSAILRDGAYKSPFPHPARQPKPSQPIVSRFDDKVGLATMCPPVSRHLTHLGPRSWRTVDASTAIYMHIAAVPVPDTDRPSVIEYPAFDKHARVSARRAFPLIGNILSAPGVDRRG